jgi:protein phosphatase
MPTISYPAGALVILCGPSGSGKSTFAARHFRPSQIVSSDACRVMICDEAATQAINDDAFALLSHILDLRLKHRRLTVVDSTALKPGARDNLTRLAKKHQVPCFVLALDVPADECIRRDALRPERQVGEHVIRRHHAQFENAKREIARDRAFDAVHILTPREIESVVIAQGSGGAPPARDGAAWDVIGDVHGCFAELGDLLETLGYRWDERGLPVHPDGRIPVFVGDLADRGPDSPGVLRLVSRLVAAGEALFVPGNHDDKLFRMLRGNKVTRSHGLDLTERQLLALPPRERAALEGDILSYLATQPPYLVLDGGRFVVAHAGIREDMIGRTGGRVREFTLYGDVRGFEPGTNKPIRHDWAREYGGSALIAYGHTPQDELKWVNNTVNLDLGCVFGGALAALRYPEREFVSVPARAQYAERL